MARIVLVADDSPTIQKRALGILKGEGYEVETVSNGVAAIKRLGALHPVVVLADVSMPGRDGYEVCDFVKKSPDLARVPVLLVASDMEPYDEARGAQVRADGIIKKPFEAHELISMVAKFAGQAEMETPTLAAPVASPVAPPAAPPPPPEYAFAHESLDETVLAPQPAQHDFSGVSEGVAFSEPAHEEPSGYSMQPAAEMEMTYAPPSGDLEMPLEPHHTDEFADTFAAHEPAKIPTVEFPLVIDEATATVTYAAPPHEHPHPHADEHSYPPAQEHQPSYLEGLEASTAASEPVFIEEPTAPVKAPRPPEPQFRTMIFRAPLEIAEPVWKDETEPAAPVLEHEHEHEHEFMPASASASPAELELAPAPAAAEAPVEIPSELTAEPQYLSPSVTATSLDSFSLDDAAAGQVQFASAVADIGEMPVHATPLDEVPTLEIPLLEPELEPAPAASAAPEAPAELAFEPPSMEATAPMVEPALEFEPTPAEAPAHEAPVHAEAAAVVEAALISEVAPLAEAEVAPAAEAALAVEAAPVTEAAPIAEAAPVDHAPAAAEALAAEAPVAEAPTEAEVPAEPAPTGPILDWALLYSVVHRTVVRMSPPVLPPEVVDELARRLASEIAAEISAESSQSLG